VLVTGSTPVAYRRKLSLQQFVEIVPHLFAERFGFGRQSEVHGVGIVHLTLGQIRKRLIDSTTHAGLEPPSISTVMTIVV